MESSDPPTPATKAKTSGPKPLNWRSVETAPECPANDYLVIDSLGYIHVTRHRRSTLMNAGWAEGWHPMKGEVGPDGLNAQEGGMKIAAMHAREFKRLLTGHRMPPDTVIEGVKLAGTDHAALVETVWPKGAESV